MYNELTSKMHSYSILKTVELQDVFEIVGNVYSQQIFKIN